MGILESSDLGSAIINKAGAPKEFKSRMRATCGYGGLLAHPVS